MHPSSAGEPKPSPSPTLTQRLPCACTELVPSWRDHRAEPLVAALIGEYTTAWFPGKIHQGTWCKQPAQIFSWTQAGWASEELFYCTRLVTSQIFLLWRKEV